MATEGSSNTAIVVVFLVLVLAGAAFFAYRGGYLGGGDKQDVNINVKMPTSSAPASPSTP